MHKNLKKKLRLNGSLTAFTCNATAHSVLMDYSVQLNVAICLYFIQYIHVRQLRNKPIRISNEN